jgi:hypothetical protein
MWIEFIWLRNLEVGRREQGTKTFPHKFQITWLSEQLLASQNDSTPNLYFWIKRFCFLTNWNSYLSSGVKRLLRW